jgi:hypothetical protein
MNCANEPEQESGEEEISAKTCNELIKKYESIVYDYLAVMNSSETVKSMDSSKYAVQLGLSAITHIYKLAFCLTKNVATSGDHCQKGIYCFIEYIEQTYKLGYAAANSMQFDFVDAVAFIYDKTIADLRRDYDGVKDQGSSSSSSLENMLSVSPKSEEHPDTEFLKCKSVLENFGRIISVLAWFNHPTMILTDQMEIVDSHLIDFLEYSSFSSNMDIFLFLETVQETVAGMDKKEYCDFLCAVKKQMKKTAINGGGDVLSACLYLKTMRGMTLKEMGEQERWKKGVNDLAKLGVMNINPFRTKTSGH